MARKRVKSACYIFYCGDEHYSRGLCRRHYQNLLRYGTPITPFDRDVVSLFEMILSDEIPENLEELALMYTGFKPRIHERE